VRDLLISCALALRTTAEEKDQICDAFDPLLVRTIPNKEAKRHSLSWEISMQKWERTLKPGLQL
jgi:hypothetical protein